MSAAIGHALARVPWWKTPSEVGLERAIFNLEDPKTGFQTGHVFNRIRDDEDGKREANIETDRRFVMGTTSAFTLAPHVAASERPTDATLRQDAIQRIKRMQEVCIRRAQFGAEENEDSAAQFQKELLDIGLVLLSLRLIRDFTAADHQFANAVITAFRNEALCGTDLAEELNRYAVRVSMPYAMM